MKFVVITDLHFGNPRIDYDLLDASLNKFFYPEVIKSDVVFIAGDTFDNSLNLTSHAAKYLFKFVMDLGDTCKISNTKLRVLRGTIIHDRNQPEVFNKLSTKGVDVKVISEPAIEEIDNISVGYLPDNLPYLNPTDAADYFRNNTDKKIHLGIFHGMFDFVMPPDIPLPDFHYTADTFTGIFSGAILSGHIHTGGSKQADVTIMHVPTFERFSHGEEGKKGFVTGEITDSNCTLHFLENTDAQKYLTCRPKSTTPEDIIPEIERYISKHFTHVSGGLQIQSDIPEVKQILSSVLKDRYPFIKITFKKKKDNKKSTFIPTDLPLLHTDTSIIPTAINLPVLVHDYLSDRQYKRIEELTVEEIDRLITSLIK